MEEKNIKICDLSQENTKKLAELIMMVSDIETLLNGNTVEKVAEGEAEPISCLKEDIICQNNQLKVLAEKLLGIKNVLN